MLDRIQNLITGKSPEKIRIFNRIFAVISENEDIFENDNTFAGTIEGSKNAKYICVRNEDWDKKKKVEFESGLYEINERIKNISGISFVTQKKLKRIHKNAVNTVRNSIKEKIEAEKETTTPIINLEIKEEFLNDVKTPENSELGVIA